MRLGIFVGLLSSLWLAAGACPAQTLYKCGSTFSQTPCASTAEEVTVPKGRTATTASTEVPGQGLEMCRAAVPRMSGVKDPYSAVIESIGEVRHDTLRIGDESVIVKRYDVLMNAKNSYGAYAGAKLYRCFVSVDEKRLLEVQVPP